jgi:hypothetical protein
MAEIGLGIGAERRLVDGIEREWLFWYDLAQAQNREIYI